ncbi:IS110 family transposase [Neisseria shayeganii]|uniref:IS116/IS110/IS902 family transposase n=1 Tax=Neisseria shayeganii 871 TaxID=1032488 RepID=G4CLJ1_9NEIS|nr:IS110 family transposase [Neisseria shayeganii]EGY51310.1 IS116/IS110/IS902 family transposase [Neisseria shayeganii 871]
MTILGCDVSKDKIDLCFLLLENKQHYLQISNNRSGYLKAQAAIEELGIQPHICMEATGVYYEGLADFMVEQGYPVSVVNPLKIKSFAKSRFQRTKTDKQDAKLIAEYCRDLKPKPDYVKPSADQYAMRRAITLFRQLRGDLTGIKNRIKTAKDPFVKTILAKQAEEFKNHIEAVKEQLATLTEQAESRQAAAKLQTIPGIGQTTASVLAHYLTMYRFDTENKFIAFAGLAPQWQKSGTSVNRKERLSKYGNRILKGELYMPALVAYRFGFFAKFVDRLKAKGKPTKVILVALMRKLAAIAWNLWHNGQDFDPSRYGLPSKTA